MHKEQQPIPQAEAQPQTIFRPPATQFMAEFNDWITKIPELYAAGSGNHDRALFNIPEAVEMMQCVTQPDQGTVDVDLLILEKDTGWADVDQLLLIISNHLATAYNLEILNQSLAIPDNDQELGTLKSRELSLHLVPKTS